MADLGLTLYVGETTKYITRADGYAPSDGYQGYSYNFNDLSVLSDKEVNRIVSTNASDQVYNSLPIPPTGGATLYYVMRGRDVDCGSVTYRSWTVSGTPDTTGSQYVGTKCGASALADIVVVFSYTG